MQPNGTVDEDLDPYLRADNDYPFPEALMLKADKKSKLYQLAVLESFVRYAVSKMKGLRGTGGYQAISPDMMPNESLIKYGLTSRLDQHKWTDAQKLYAYAANSFDWFNNTNVNLINLWYLEDIKVADLFNNPYIATLYERGVLDTNNDKDIAQNWATIVERACRHDKEGVKAEETRLYELSELLGEHDYNVKRGIEKEIERALYD
jgi:hypothetical protein